MSAYDRQSVVVEKIMGDENDVKALLDCWHPFDLLPKSVLDSLKDELETFDLNEGETVFNIGEQVENLYVVGSGMIEIRSPEGEAISQRGSGETYGAWALQRGGKATHSAVCTEPGRQFAIPADHFHKLLAEHESFAKFFNLRRDAQSGYAESAIDTVNALATAKISEIMTPDPAMVEPNSSIRSAAQLMSELSISCVLVCRDGKLIGILTSRDLATRAVATGLDVDSPVEQVMSKNPTVLSPNHLYVDSMIEMSSKGIGHLPVTEGEIPVGIITRTDLVRRSNVSPVYMISDIWRLDDIGAMAEVVSNLPQLLAQLVGSGVDAHRVGFVITGVADALTKRLLRLAEKELGQPPIPYLWLACGSQGRQEQTGVSDQDNCLMLDDRYDEKEHGEFFQSLAKFVSDGLNKCGYVYCPGDMMATNPKWRQPVRVWREYFNDWVQRPNPMAQMLASVMFDLRPIEGEHSLFEGIQTETLKIAGKNSIFLAHMISNSLKHTPPLGLIRGFALIRSGEHKHTFDLKHTGTVPIVDLARLYAIQAGIRPVNTRERLMQAQKAGVLSGDGAQDLIDAYDLISDIRLEHQAQLVKDGKNPDNFVPPSNLSALQRNHLKNAFGVVKTIQSALSYKSVH